MKELIHIKDFTSKIPLTYKLFLLLSGFFIFISLLFNTPYEILVGLKNIILSSDILISDYVVIGGLGATLTNAALLIIMYVLMLIILGIDPSGPIIAGLFTVSGFAMFGKNILNVWPVILGIYIYAKVQKEKFSKLILACIFGSTMSPAFIQLINSTNLPNWISIILGLSISVFMGFILPPVASACPRFHHGFSLYNVGLAGGLIGTMTMSLFRAFGIDFTTTLIWAEGYNKEFSIIFFIIFAAMFCIGYYINGKSFNDFRKIKKCSGRLITDFYILFGEGVTLINMSILGMFSLALLLILGIDLNGPTIGGILTIVGFGAFGKHISNIIPVMVGILLSTYLNVWDISNPSVILALLFCTCLAPIAGAFGFFWGVMAGMVHSCIVMQTSYLHGGMILYNNGFAAGLVCMFLVPIITAFRKEL